MMNLNPTNRPTDKKQILKLTKLAILCFLFAFGIFLTIQDVIEYKKKPSKAELFVLNEGVSKDDGKTLADFLTEGAYKENTTKSNSKDASNIAEKVIKKPLRVFSADMEMGLIGKDPQFGLDNPKDNFFKVHLDKGGEGEYVLEYEVFGLDENTIPGKSINNRYVSGGYMVSRDNKWIAKSEPLDYTWLNEGENLIFFSAPEDADYQYRVRNVKIVQVENETKSSLINLTKKTLLVRDGKQYVQGYVSVEEPVSVFANNQRLNLREGVFEGFVDVDPNGNLSLKLVSNEKSLVLEEQFYGVGYKEADFKYDIKESLQMAAKSFTAFQKSEFNIGKAAVKIGDSALVEDKIISSRILRPIDMAPTQSGFKNVTSEGTGYRFLPDGTKFNEMVSLSIPYDESKIPDGYTAKDIKTYYFDLERKKWQVVERDSIDFENKLIVSKTNHFTDYINGIIQVPESPQTNAFAPTMMNDIKAVSPFEGMNFISPPEASQDGTANLSYPIKIPSGRNGLQPSIALSYNSDAGNGWLGQGWNLNIPALTIDTRWGTPKFDSQFESEIYMLNGQQLMYPKIKNDDDEMVDWMPNRHYDASSTSNSYTTVDRQRISQAVFTPRVQGSFLKIERLGSTPANYYWKVTATDGTVYWYGGKTSVVSNSVIKDGNSNIVHWGLYRVEDVFGNNIKYTYTNYLSSGFNGADSNLNGGRVFRISNIYYTGYNNANGVYRVQFINQGTTSSLRLDPTITGRLGVKQVEPGLLKEIRVSQSGSIIRKYVLTYGEGVFFKSQLEKVSELDASGNEFYAHTFEYYNDRHKNLFTSPENINVPSLSANYTLGLGNQLNSSRVNSGEATEFSWSGRGAVGLCWGDVTNDPGWVFTVGGLFGEGYTQNKGKVTLVDMDGNGLDDVLFRNGDNLTYFPHKVDVNGSHFFANELKTIVNINNFQKTKGRTVTKFGESFDLHALRFYGGKKRFKTEEETEIYITDGNGDLLPDIVNNNNVYFNTGLNGSGNNVFETSSEGTPNMLITAEPALISPEDVEDPEPDSPEMTNYDVVRVWIAPKSGYVRIKDTVQYNPEGSNGSVVYSIEMKLNSSVNSRVVSNQSFRVYLGEFDNSNLTDNILVDQVSDYSPPLGYLDLTGDSTDRKLFVGKGGKIFFRLHKNSETDTGFLITNPIVEYVDSASLQVLPQEIDSDGKDRNSFDYGNDYVLNGIQGVGIPDIGDIQIEWDDFDVVSPSDDLDYLIIQETRDLLTGDLTESVLYSKHCSAGSLTNVAPTSAVNNFSIPSIPVDSEVSIKFYVKSDSNVDWKAVEWRPSLVYEPSNSSELGFIKYPIPEYSIFKEEYDLGLLNSIYDLQLPVTSLDYGILPNTFNDPNGAQPLGQDDNGEFMFVVKKDDVVIGKRLVTINQGNISLDNSSPIIFNNGSSTDVSIDFGFYTKGKQNYELYLRYDEAFSGFVNGSITGVAVIGNINEWNNYPITDYSHFVRGMGYVRYGHGKYLGSLNRGWGQFLYDDELDENSSLPSDTYGKLINSQIVDSPLENLSDQLSNLGIDISYCIDTYTNEEDVQDCIDNLINTDLNIPAEGSIDENTDLEGLLENILSGMNLSGLTSLSAFRSMEPFRYSDENDYVKDKWIGLSDNQFSAPDKMKNGIPISSELLDAFTNPDDAESPYLSPDQNTGMVAINKVQRSAAKSYSAGWGSVVYAQSESSYSNTVSDFLDVNGDRYPDLMTSLNIQPTNMTGGHTDSQNHDSSPLISNDSHNSSLSGSKNYPIAGRKKVSQNNQDSGNPKFHAGLGVSATLAGENKERDAFIDLNGDGLPDRIEFENDSFSYKLNLGNSFAASTDNFSLYDSNETHPNSLNVNFALSGNFELGNVPFDVSLGYSVMGGNTDVSFQDINGDGLVDVLLFDDSNTAYVKYNVGNKIIDQAIPLTFETDGYLSLFGSSKSSNASLSGDVHKYWGTHIIWGIYFKYGGSLGGSSNLTVTETERQFRDFDNDGFPDYVKKNGDDLEVYYSKIGRTSKLKTVSNQLGGSFTIDYESKNVDFDSPVSRWVMSSVKQEGDNVGILDNSSIGEYYKFFEYDKGYYDRREREFFGYEIVETNEYLDPENVSSTSVPYRTLRNEYHNRNYFLKGALKSTKLYKDGDENNYYSETSNTYKLYTVNEDGTINLGNEVQLDFDTGGKEGRRQAAPLLIEALTKIKEFSSDVIQSKVTFTYDGYGRVVEYLDYGDTSYSSDDYRSVIEYHSGLNNNLISVPKNLKVYTGLSNGTLKRERLTEVANSNTGRITKIKSWLSGSTYAETDMTYDSYGNLTSLTLPQNAQGQSMQYTYQYDSTYHKYLGKITDVFGYSSENYYDSKFDVVTKSIDLAGNETRYGYDTFGRMITVLGPKEIENGAAYTISFDYDPLSSNSSCENTFGLEAKFAVSRYYDYQNPQNPIETYTFVDGFGRPLQVKKDIQINKGTLQSPQYEEYMSVSGRVVYDVFGRAVKQYHPNMEEKNCVENMYLNSIVDPQSNYFVETKYDVLDRGIMVTDQAGNETEVGYGLSTDGFGILSMESTTTLHQGSEDVMKSVYKDVRGRATSTKDVGPSGDIWTKFTYSQIGELLSYVDDQGITTNSTYDNLGRRVQLKHPDNGTTRYSYDLAGNMVKIETANLLATGTSIDYQYDYNRLIGITFPATGGANISDVTYSYGQANSGNETGRLIYQQDATGTQEFKYGNMGELIQTKRTVVAPNLPTRIFQTDFLYDSFNRLKAMKYPDGETLTYSYDLGGNLFHVAGEFNGSPYEYIRTIEYDHFEQQTAILYGNGTYNRYDYDPILRRLSNSLAVTSGNDAMFNNTYGYDNIGNVTTLQNTATANPNNQLGGTFSHSYKYDKLNRLIHAEGAFAGSGNNNSNYGLDMGYNNVHGIEAKKQSHYQSGSANQDNTYYNKYNYISGTHKVDKIEDQNTSTTKEFKYDLNGNMTWQKDFSNNLRDLFWDESNRLRVVSENHMMQHYLYDASGERVLKAASQEEQVYVNGQLVNGGSVVFSPYTTYANAYLVINANQEYSKHYYMGAKRFATKIGEQNVSIFDGASSARVSSQSTEKTTKSTAESFSPDELRQSQVMDLTKILDGFKKGAPKFAEYETGSANAHKSSVKDDEETVEIPRGETEIVVAEPVAATIGGIYYFHSDHLGSSTYLTDIFGDPYQFFINLPFGETMFEQHSYTENYVNPYKFNGKELDRETGLYYYGARYYDPSISVWLSVDPLAEKYPNMNPFNFTMQNPLRYIDPNGMESVSPEFDIKSLDKPEKGRESGVISDWFKNENGDIRWFDNESKTFSDGNGNWLNVGSNLEEVKSFLGISDNMFFEFTSYDAFLFTGADGFGGRWGLPAPLAFDGGVCINYDLLVGNTNDGKLIDGVSEITGVLMNMTLGVTTSAPGVRLYENLTGNFSINESWTPSGKRSDITSNNFSGVNIPMLYGGFSGGATGKASLTMSLGYYKRMTRNYTSNPGGVRNISINSRVAGKITQNNQIKSFSVATQNKL